MRRRDFATDHTIDLTRPFYFGALPKKIDVETKLHRLLERRSSIFKPEPSIQLAQLTVPNRTDTQKLVSTAQIFIPRAEVIARLGDRSKKEVIEFIEQTSGALYALRMTFTSRVEKAADGSLVINHQCEWNADADRLRFEQPLVYAQIDDDALHRVIIGREKQSGPLWTWQPGDEFLSGKEENVSAQGIGAKNARMNIVLGNGLVLGSIPFSFWHGETSNR
jgi:hypothetical protein